MRTWLLALTLLVGAASTANAKELQFRQLDTDRYADVLKRNICPPLSERVRRPLQNEVCGGDGTHSCVYRKPHPNVMPPWNRLSWRDDRAVLLRSVRACLAIQVEVTT
jgi:hypothetical protein